MLNFVRSHAKFLMKKHGLYLWKFDFDHARRRAGKCCYRTKTIALSVHYVTSGNSITDITDTILHEIAHALAGRSAGHGSKWKSVCLQIGAKPERCYDASKIKMPEGRFSATCSGCGKKFRRHRRPKRSRCCLRCGPLAGILIFSSEH